MKKSNLPRILLFVMLFLVVVAIGFLIWIKSTQRVTGNSATPTATPLAAVGNQSTSGNTPSPTVGGSPAANSAVTATPGGIKPPVIPVELTPVR